MKYSLRFFLSMFVFVSFVLIDGLGNASACEAVDIIGKIQHRLSEVKDYKLEASIKLKDEQFSSQITGKEPNRLNIRLEMPKSSFYKTQSTCFDGTFQWVELVAPSSTQVYKVQLSEVIVPGRPFDTSYYIMGSGLFNGEGYVETIELLLSLYNLEAVCSSSTIKLQGPVIFDKYKQYLLQKRSSAGKDPSEILPYIKQFTQSFGYLRMEFSAKDYIIQKYSLGTEQNKEEFTVQFKKVSINQNIKNEVFSYTPPSGIETTDITKDIKQMIGIKQ